MSSIDTPHRQPADLTLASQESIQQIEAVFPDILRWPESWMGDEHDLIAGHLNFGRAYGISSPSDR